MAMPVKQIQFDKQDVVTCDDRGRATLGSEYANEQVFVYIAELPDTDDVERPSEDERLVLSAMARWARENDVAMIDAHPEDGTVEDKQGVIHDTPYSLDDPPEHDRHRVDTGRTYVVEWGDGNAVSGEPLMQVKIGPDTVVHIGGNPSGDGDSVQVTPDDVSALDGSKGFSEDLPVDTSEYPYTVNRDGYQTFTIRIADTDDD